MDDGISVSSSVGGIVSLWIWYGAITSMQDFLLLSDQVVHPTIWTSLYSTLHFLLPKPSILIRCPGVRVGEVSPMNSQILMPRKASGPSSGQVDLMAIVVVATPVGVLGVFRGGVWVPDGCVAVTRVASR